MNSFANSSNESMDFGGRLQNHRRAGPFRLCVNNLHICHRASCGDVGRLGLDHMLILQKVVMGVRHSIKP